MKTTLLGRKGTNSIEYLGTIVCVYNDRGEIKILIENSEHHIHDINLTSVTLKEKL